MAWEQPKFALCEINVEFEFQWLAIAPKALGQRCKSLGEMQSFGRTYSAQKSKFSTLRAFF